MQCNHSQSKIIGQVFLFSKTKQARVASWVVSKIYNNSFETITENINIPPPKPSNNNAK